jgi:hypothetical protein
VNIDTIRALTGAGLCMLAAAFAAPASALTVTGTYTGVVTSADGPIDSFIHANDAFSFSYSYETVGGTDILPGDPNTGEWHGISLTVTGSIGSYVFATGTPLGDNYVTVTNEGGFDRLVFDLAEPITGLVDTFHPAEIFLQLNALSTLFSSDALPDSHIPASLFTDGQFIIAYTDDVSVFPNVHGTLSVATTPIPAALPLFLSALGGLGFAGWRRRARE